MVNDFSEIQESATSETQDLTATVETMDQEPGEGIQLGPDDVPPAQYEHQRNIIYIGDKEPSTAYHGALRVNLPDAETQRKGFYHPQARQIIQHLPKLYKKFVRKGE
jgi:hypothetical protein